TVPSSTNCFSPDRPGRTPMSSDHAPQPGAPASPPRLLDLLRQATRQLGHPEDTVAAFADWARRFILFHGKRHPRDLGLPGAARLPAPPAQPATAPLRDLAAARDALDFLSRQSLPLALGELPLPRPPRLLDQVRQVLRVRHYALSTEDCYVQWIIRF